MISIVKELTREAEMNKQRQRIVRAYTWLLTQESGEPAATLKMLLNAGVLKPSDELFRMPLDHAWLERLKTYLRNQSCGF
jgi:hypothetical protein